MTGFTFWHGLLAKLNRAVKSNWLAIWKQILLAIVESICWVKRNISKLEFNSGEKIRIMIIFLGNLYYKKAQ